MRTHGIRAALAALAMLAPALAPACAAAQEPVGTPVPREVERAQTVYRFVQRGILGIYTEPVPRNAMTARQQLVVDVVAGSPAANAGVMKGDTLLSINDLAASHQVMSLPFEPGDTLVLRVRRDGRERDLTVVAAARTQFRGTLPDSLGERVRVMVDRYIAGADSLKIRARTIPTVRQFTTDSTMTIVIGTDTITTVHTGPRSFVYSMRALPPDSVLKLYGNMQMGMDSLAVRFGTLFDDSARIHLRRLYDDNARMRMLADSARWHVEGILPRFYSDSANVRFFTPARAGTWTVGTDSLFMGGLDILTTHAVVGTRAIAGAELAPLNPGLSQYFGTADGVLVLNARDGTPAAIAGLRSGDVIVRVGDITVKSIIELRRAVEQHDDGDITLRVVRRGQNVNVTLER